MEKPGWRAGVQLSKSVTFAVLLLYLVQSVGTLLLVRNHISIQGELRMRERVIYDHRARIDELESEVARLEEQVRIIEVIETFRTSLSEAEGRDLAAIIQQESARYCFDPLLVLALIGVESSFRTSAVSKVGARGLMQLMPATAEAAAAKRGLEIERSDLFDPDINVTLGTQYLFEMILDFGDVRTALAAYNMGETRLRSRIRRNVPLPSDYSNRVMAAYDQIRKVDEPPPFLVR